MKKKVTKKSLRKATIQSAIQAKSHVRELLLDIVNKSCDEGEKIDSPEEYWKAVSEALFVGVYGIETFLKRTSTKTGVQEVKKKVIWSGSNPENCQLCKKKYENYFIDGRLPSGIWAVMCIECHQDHGDGLGRGHGQKFDAKTLELVEGE